MKDRSKGEPPVVVGEIVGHAEKRAQIVYLPRDWKHKQLLIHYLDGSGSNWVSIGALHDAPPVTAHIQEAARECVESGFLADPLGTLLRSDA